MNLENLDIAGRRCRLFSRVAPQCLLVQALSVHENDTLPNEIEEIAADSPIPFVMAAFEIADWRMANLPQMCGPAGAE